MIGNSSSMPYAIRMQRTAITIATLAVVVTFTLPTSVWAAANAARTIYAIVDVSATDSSGTRRALKKGDFVATGDTVITARGRAQIKLTVGSFVALNPNTEYAIEEYEYDAAQPSKGRSFFNLLKGGVRMVTGAVARSNRKGWRMRTSVATIGIRGSGGYFRYVGPSTLRVSVDFGGFTSTDPATGLESDLGPGEYVCNSPCRPINGPDAREDPGRRDFFIPDQDDYESGEQVDSGGEGPIPAGPAPDGTHISVSFAFIEANPSFPGFMQPEFFLNSLADGEDTDGMQNTALFGTLDEFEWFTGFPCENCAFLRNNGTEIVDPAPDGSTFSTTFSTEWGRVINEWTVVDAFGQIIAERGHFTHVETTGPTPDMELPTTGIMVYNQDLGGTRAAHTYGTAEDMTEVANVRTQVHIEVDYSSGVINDFHVAVPPGGFPSGSSFVLQSAMPTPALITDGFLFFNSAASTITVPAGSIPDLATGSTGMCNTGCTFFGTVVYGAAGVGTNTAGAVTFAFQGNTSQPSYPAHSVNGAGILGLSP